MVKKAATVIKDEKFTIRKAKVLAPFDNSTNRFQMCWHTFHKTDTGVLHRCDDVDRAAVTTENWPDYVKSNDAAALACGYSAEVEELEEFLNR